MITAPFNEPLPKLHCHVCGKVVTINADRGKYRRDFLDKGPKRFRFYCSICADNAYKAAVKRGYVIHGWILAPKWFGRACVTIRRRIRQET